SVLTSRLPSSLPSRLELKTTAALLIGLPLNFFTTVTSIWEVGGGALYLRPRRAGASCAMVGRQATKAMLRRRASWKVRRNCMVSFYDVSRGACGFGPLGPGLRDFHSDFTLAI